MKNAFASLLTCGAGAVFTAVASANTFNISALNPAKSDTGYFPEGAVLTISATGTVVLVQGHTYWPDGSLAAPLSPQDTRRIHALPGAKNYPTAYGGDGVNHFAGGGMNYAPGFGDISWPVAGKQTTDTRDSAAIRFGALVGTFSESPGHEDWFCIGFGKTVIVPRGGAHLYLLVNDSWFPDNSGSFSVTIEQGQRATTDSTREKSSAVPATARVYIESPGITTLLRDNVFGHALPPGIGLANKIEISLDLVNWTAATNVVLYFKDLDSPNYSRRFYRFIGP